VFGKRLTLAELTGKTDAVVPPRGVRKDGEGEKGKRIKPLGASASAYLDGLNPLVGRQAIALRETQTFVDDFLR
jgi:hypothetical protein